MTGSDFVPIIPGAIDDLVAEHNLPGRAGDLLLWLAVTSERHDGMLQPITTAAVAEAKHWTWRRVDRAVAELVGAELVEAHLPQGHAGWIRLLCLDDIVWRKQPRSRAPARGFRGSARGSRASARGFRDSAQTSRANDTQKKKTSSAVDAAASGEAPSTAGGAGAPTSNGDTEAPDVARNLDGIEQARGALRRRPA